VTEKQPAVLISGACGGIGRALCNAFRKAGYFIIATDVVAEGDACNCDRYIRADLEELVADESLGRSFAAEINTALTGKELKGLINNAALQKLAHLDELDLADFRASLDINVTAPLLLSRLFLDALAKARGSIVNVGSIHASLTKPAFISYATSKAALQGLTRALAVDLGDQLRVNAIQPAATDTEMLREGFRGNPAGLASLEKYHPANRLAMPEEIAATAVFLVSDECGFMTGSVINVDGGIGARLHDPG